jgi:hypothetical protein
MKIGQRFLTKLADERLIYSANLRYWIDVRGAMMIAGKEGPWPSAADRNRSR